MSGPAKHAAKVDDKGSLQFAEPLRWKVALSRLRGQVIYVSLHSFKVNRTNAQNRRYWGMIVPLVAEILSQSIPQEELPVSNDEAHYELKKHFIGFRETPLGKIPKSSKRLTVEEFAEYCRKIEEWLATTYGIVIPERGESLEDTIA